MKIHRVVKMLGATTTTGKLASDMYDLNYKTYYSEEEDGYIPISHMDFQHMVRAFVKLCEQEKKVMMGANDIALTKDEALKAKDHIIDGLRSQVETLGGIIDEKDELIDKWSEAEHRWRKAYQDVAHTKGHYYTFSEVPQDEEGKEFVKNCRKYLNKESYKIRVKGQHLKKELYGQGKAYHGANMGDCTHMRVYIDTK